MSNLIVHLLYHPDSEAARDIAVALDWELFVDPALPGLKIPTVFTPKRAKPTPIGLDQADCTVVVALIDAVFTADPAWRAFAADTYEACLAAGHRFIPIALYEHAYPLDRRLAGVNFARAWVHEGGALRRFVLRWVLVELCRLLDPNPVDDTRLPVTLFLSHAKADLRHDPEVFAGLVAALDACTPIGKWIDCVRIAPGSAFADAIDDGVRNTAMLVLLTDAFSSRPWCRREVLLAKRHGRPLVVVDARTRLTTRTFPYLGNTPMLRWQSEALSSSADAVVDLVLKETLRVLHALRTLSRSPEAQTRAVLAHPPELVTAQPRLLYPDPPLGEEELDLLSDSGVDATTPLQVFAQRHSLAGRVVAVSTSPSDDLAQWGVSDRHQDTAVTEVSRYLLIAGAQLAYGGHLSENSKTFTLFDLITQHLPYTAAPDVVRSYVGWPIPLTIEDKAKHAMQGELIAVGRPDGFDESQDAAFTVEPEWFGGDTPRRRYAWARSMTKLRQRIIADTQARVVIGGKIGPPPGRDGDPRRWSLGRMPGVLEECLLSIEAGHPLYLCGAFGGATRLAVDLIEGRDRTDATWDWHQRAPHAEGMRDLYESAGDWQPWTDIVATFKGIGVEGLSAVNRLSPEENRRLFVATDPQAIVELILSGLSRLG